VSDIDKSIAFYERLGLSKISDEARTGAQQIHGLNELPLTADAVPMRRASIERSPTLRYGLGDPLVLEVEVYERWPGRRAARNRQEA